MNIDDSDRNFNFDSLYAEHIIASQFQSSSNNSPKHQGTGGIKR